MPQTEEIQLPGAVKGIVVYPDGKQLKKPVYDPNQHHVVLHYDPPHEPDIATSSPADPNLFVVPSALAPGLQKEL